MKAKTISLYVICLFLFGCIRSEADNLIQEIENDILEKVELSKSNLTLNVGDEVCLCDLNTLRHFSGNEQMISVMHYPTTLTTPEYSWLSTDPVIARVMNNTKLVALNPGKTTLIAKVKGLSKKAVCVIKVNKY
ncbi:MAG: hypothetical protein PHQ88_05940 [Bacteroides sp.]|nr:Ig-like domain-containing protein [Bacteroides sp.]MDD2645691.1 hypothetical protein [Bacteroides sp.]MDD4720382.1 hypothetical protein [Bacteroides sp.]